MEADATLVWNKWPKERGACPPHTCETHIHLVIFVAGQRITKTNTNMSHMDNGNGLTAKICTYSKIS